MQAQEQKLAALADHLLRLRASGASPKQRKRLMVQALSEFDETRRTASHTAKQVHTTPSPTRCMCLKPFRATSQTGSLCGQAAMYQELVDIQRHLLGHAPT